MAKTSVYLPDDLAAQARAYSVPVSEIAQVAVRQAVAEASGKPCEPTGEQCSAHESVEVLGRSGFAIWYPQMGGYVGKAIVLPDSDDPDDCFDVLVWHDGEFPFPGMESGDLRAASPTLLHHCDAGQFIVFGETVQTLMGGVHE